MKNLKKIVVTLLTMTLFMSVSAFAATVDDVKAKLVEAGLGATYADQVAAYLTTNTITEAQANTIVANVKDVQTKVGSRTEASQFTAAELAALKTEIQTTANTIGLKVTSDGTNIIVLNAAGNKVGESSIANIKTAAANFDSAAFVKAVELAKEYVAQPSATAMKKTATNNGNVLVVGLGVLALSGAAFVASKKVRA